MELDNLFFNQKSEEFNISQMELPAVIKRDWESKCKEE